MNHTAALLVAAAFAFAPQFASAAETAVTLPPPATEAPAPAGMDSRPAS